MHAKEMNGSQGKSIRSNSKLARQQGASLLEAIAYLGIAAIVVMGAISLLTGAFGSAKSNQAKEELIALSTAVRKLYMGQTYPTTNIVSTLITAKAVPGTLAADGTTLKNSWGGTVTIAGNADGRFDITYPAVPKDVCISMLSGANGWYSIKGSQEAAITFPLTAKNAMDQCGTDSNSIIFTSS